MSYSFRTRSATVLVAGVAVGTLALGACGSAGSTLTPAASTQTQPAILHLDPTGVAPSCLANYCAGLPDTAGDRGGPSPSSGHTSTPAASRQTQPASPHRNPTGMAPGGLAYYCAGLPDAVGERGGPSPRR